MILEDGKSLGSDQSIHEVEKLVGHKLPRAYKKIAIENDGATSEYGVKVFILDKNREVFIECSEFIPFVYEAKPSLSMAGYNANGQTPHKPDGLVAFAIDGAGFMFCFDYRASEDPEIVILTNNWVSEPVIPVAKTFDDFWAMLVPFNP